MGQKRSRVTERDRDYMRRLGDLKAASHREALRDHLALSLEERLQRSWEFLEQLPAMAWHVEPADGALELYRTASQLGLYRDAP
jgi:hypothetical protein